MIRKYKIEYGFMDWECTLEINETIFTPELLKEALDFFVWDYDKTNNLYEEYAKKIAKQVILLSMTWNEEGIIDEFIEMEGFPPLDGSMGVKLIRCDTFEFDDDEFSCVVKSD